MLKSKVVRKYVTDEMSKFKDTRALDEFVQTLNDDETLQLLRWLSVWRKNSVFDIVSKGPKSWSTGVVDICDIEVGQINDKINLLLKKRNYLLERISRDQTICNHKEFGSQGKMVSKEFLAIKSKEGKYKIIDGAHRVIRLACDGVKKFKLVYIEEVSLRSIRMSVEAGRRKKI